MKEYRITPGGWQLGAICMCRDALWVFDSEIDALIEIEARTGLVKGIYRSSNGPLFQKNLYIQIILWNDQLFLIPYMASGIKVFDLLKKSFVDENNVGIKHIRCACRIENQIFLFPCSCNDEIILYNMEEKRICSKIAIDGCVSFTIGTNFALDKENIYVPAYLGEDKGEIVKININDLSAKTLGTNYTIPSIANISVCQECIMCSTLDDRIVYLSKSSMDENDGIGKGTMILGQLGENTIIESYENKHYYVAHGKDMKIIEGLQSKNIELNSISAWQLTEDNAILFDRSNCVLYVLNSDFSIKTKTELCCQLDLSDLDITGIVSENEFFSLESFVGLL